MRTEKNGAAAKRAALLGGLCSVSYLVVYVARNILGTVSPQMIEQGLFATEQIGTLSSAFFITYAIGQLINGIIGDRIRAKYMLGFGMILAGLCNLLFAALSAQMAAATILYAMFGFFLSMIYGPMTKVIAENMTPTYATRCSVGCEFAAYFGSPLAGVLAGFLAWQAVFTAGSGLLLLMGAICLLCFTVFEKKRLIEYRRFCADTQKTGGIRVLLQNQIVRFTLIALVTGVIRTAVVFWLPTYLSQHLGFSAGYSALIFTVATLIISLAPFLSVFGYELLGQRMNLTIFLCFTVSAFGFLMVYLCRQPVWNIAFLVLAILGSNGAASMMWSRYCPSLRDTGMVSSVTGFLDFASYMAASASSAIFANSVAVIGWSRLILVWLAIMLFGMTISVPLSGKNGKTAE